MPQAENQDPDIKQHVNSLGEKLKTLRLRLRRCVSADQFFPLWLSWHFSLTPREAETDWQEDSPKAARVPSLAHFFLSREWGRLLGIYMFANSFPVICESFVGY